MNAERKSRKTQSRLYYREAFQAVHDVLIREWDPIGVGREPMAQDEYDMYIPVLLRMLADDCDDQAMADHLASIETIWMGLPAAPGTVGRNRRIARRLRQVAEQFFRHSPRAGPPSGP